MHKIALVIGHNSKAQGAERRDNREPEYVFNGRVAAAVEALAQDYPAISVKTFRRSAGGGYRKEIRRVYGEVDDWGADVAIELHFNASANPQANGCETLSSGSSGSLRLAKAINDDIVSALGIKDRGIKTIPASGRGGGSLHAGEAPAVLLEPFFGSNPSDLAKTLGPQKEKALAGAILSGAMRSAGISTSAPKAVQADADTGINTDEINKALEVLETLSLFVPQLSPVIRILQATMKRLED